MTANNSILVLCTCPTQTVADEVATALVEERLAACVNRLPEIKSIYRWEGKVTRDEEILLLIKSTTEHFPALERAIKALHPFETPEIIATPIVTGSSDYLQWIQDATR